MRNSWSLIVGTLVGFLAVSSVALSEDNQLTKNTITSPIPSTRQIEQRNGEVIKVPKHMWITIVNLSIDNGNGTFTRGDTASIEHGDTLRIEKIDQDKALVELIGRSRDAYGALAPVGSLFLVPLDEISMYNDEYQKVVDDKAKTDAYLNKLIDDIPQ